MPDGEGLNALERIIKDLEEGRITKEEIALLHFNQGDIEALRRVAARERALMALGYFAGSAKTVLTYLGLFVGAYFAIKAGVIDWINEVVRR